MIDVTVRASTVVASCGTANITIERASSFLHKMHRYVRSNYSSRAIALRPLMQECFTQSAIASILDYSNSLVDGRRNPEVLSSIWLEVTCPVSEEATSDLGISVTRLPAMSQHMYPSDIYRLSTKVSHVRGSEALSWSLDFYAMDSDSAERVRLRYDTGADIRWLA